MIDLHCHLLPGIDDGAPDLETALQLARLAVSEGITHLVCTPHIHPGRFDNTPESIQAALSVFRSALQAAAIPLTVAAAAEVHFDLSLMDAVPQQRVPYLGRWDGMDVVLLEFPHGYIPLGADRLTRWLIAQDVLPIIAHPERNKDVMRDLTKLQPFLNQGCLLQLTADAVAGRFGANCAAVSRRLLQERVVTILASDAHNVAHRPPSLRAGVEAAARIVGESQAEDLVHARPWTLASRHFVDAQFIATPA